MLVLLYYRLQSTRYPILNNALRFLENYGRYEKMFQRKVMVVGSSEGDTKTYIDLSLDSVISDQGHIDFFFFMEHPIFDGRI